MKTTPLPDRPHRRAHGRLAWSVLACALWACDSEPAPTEPDLQAVEPAAVLATYEIVPLGSLGGGSGEASDMNQFGQIVGDSERSDGRFHAFLWQDGVMRDLGALPNPVLTSSRAMDINNNGQIVGYSLANNVAGGGSDDHATLWEKGAVRDLGTLGGRASRAFDVNPFGVIVGFAQNANGRERAVRWVNGVIGSLGTLGGQTSAAIGINAAGHIVGRSQDKSGVFRAFIWRDGVMTDLGGLGGRFTQANAINAKGQITGYGEDPAGVVHAILWSGGEVTDLGVLPNDRQSYGQDIDGEGRVAGYSEAGARTRAFLWENGKLRNLGYLTGRPNRSLGISPAGDLVGSSTDASGTQVATLWRRR